MASLRDQPNNHHHRPISARHLHPLRKAEAIDGERFPSLTSSSSSDSNLGGTATVKTEEKLSRKNSAPNGHHSSTSTSTSAASMVYDPIFDMQSTASGGGGGEEKLGVSRTSSTESTSRRLEDALHSLHQLSAESVLSALGSPNTNTLSMNSPLMPPKCLIQEDIRQGGGRFELVRKRGRSEVWNLFGQVLDAQTGHRLPYVACYACKVLYTDTGGGTGNMTRHRCPLGNSYRSSFTGSSTDMTESVQQSFESTSNNFVSTDGTMSPEPRDSVSPSSIVQQQQQQPAVVITEPPYPEHDRRNFAEAAIKCCAIDLLPCSIFEGKGFQSLIETALSIGRRNARSSERSRAASLMPDPSILQLTINAQHNALKLDLKSELTAISRECGMALAINSFEFAGEQLLVISASYVTGDWRLARRTLRIEPMQQSDSSVELIWQIVADYGIDSAERLMFTTDRAYDFAHQNIQCICVTLNSVLDTVLCNTEQDVHGIVNACKNLVDGFEALGLQKALATPLKRPGEGYWMSQFPMIASVRSQLADIIFLLANNTGTSELMDQMVHLDEQILQDLEIFLEPFYEAASMLRQKSRPTFHQVLPEWYALMHECEGTEEGDEGRPWLTELRQSALKHLRLAEQRITMEHRMATVLNPRLRQLPVICTDEKRLETYARIRELIGSGKEVGSPLMNDRHPDGEPSRKRRTFLSSLEDRSMVDDELECYLRSQFPVRQTKDVLQFWSSAGQGQFPRLAKLARFLLAISAVCPDTSRLSEAGQNTQITAESLDTLLFLRSSYQA